MILDAIGWSVIGLRWLAMAVAVEGPPAVEDPAHATAGALPHQYVCVVVGAEGKPEYGEQFRQWASRWSKLAREGEADYRQIGLGVDTPEVPSPYETDRQRLQVELQRMQPLLKNHPQRSLWLVLIGHGTFDGEKAKFNLQGPDVTAKQLQQWLEPIEGRVIIVNSASSSGPFINALSGPQRIVITATKSGQEHNFARFGHYLSRAIGDLQSDLDKDEQVSLLEAFLAASASTRTYYREQSQLATEHALLDDNGDGLGTPADWFRGTRAVQAARDGAEPDGSRAARVHLQPSRFERALPAEVRVERARLEEQLEQLRTRKSALSSDVYDEQLEQLLLQLARLYQAAGD